MLSKNNSMNYNVDEKGYYGDFGGAYIPEMLYPNVEELRQNYLSITADPAFQKEFDHLLKVYVGRPTPCILPSGFSEKYKTKVYLKEKISVIQERIKSTIPLVRFYWPSVWVKSELSLRLEPDNTE